MCPIISQNTYPMSTQSLTNVPTLIHKPLELVIDLIRSEFGDEVAMIWLFGSYARGDFINDRRVGKDGVVSEYQSDIDILLVLNAPLVAGRTNQNERKLKKLAARVDKLTHALHDQPEIDRSIHLIHETLDRFNDALNHSEYFYLDVVNEGIQLVNNGAEWLSRSRCPPRSVANTALSILKCCLNRF